MPELRRTLCNRDCPDACGIVAHVEDGQVVRLAGDPEHPVTRGFLCYRTGHLLESAYHRERLTTPLYRARLDDELEPIGWDEVLDLLAERLDTIRRESGPAAIFHYRSGGSLGLLKALVDHFFEQLGPVTVKRGDICSGAGDHAQELDFGVAESNDLRELLNARNVVLWGKNVFVSSPHTIPVLREAQRAGARLVLVDPVHHQTATLCERFVQPRPGGDYALAMAVARLLFERGWVDPDAGSYCDHLEAFRALAERRGVEAWCAEADVPVADALDLAERLGPGRPATVLVGWGMGRRVNGVSIVRAIDALAAVTGNVGVPGGGASFYFRRREGFDLSFVRGKRAAPRTVCEPTFGREVLAAADPPIRAVWITAGNPVVMLPDSGATVQALRTRELVVVVDSALTDTARQAHVVLPTTTLLEEDDLVGAYGHHHVGVARPVVPPPAGVRSDLEIVQGLAARVGLADALAGTAREWKERVLSGALRERGVTLETLEQGAVRNPLAARLVFEGRRFATPNGRAQLLASPPAVAPGDLDDAEYPLTLLSLSTADAQSSQWTREPGGLATATVHPDAAGALPEGAECLLQSRLGELRVRLRFDARQRRDVVLVPKGGHLSSGRCANLLVRARLTDGGEGGALYDERVRLVPA